MAQVVEHMHNPHYYKKKVWGGVEGGGGLPNSFNESILIEEI
jgi:hypothetical protein